MDESYEVYVKALQDQGFDIRTNANGHGVVMRGSAVIATFSGTADDWRAIRNCLPFLKRHGFWWPLTSKTRN